MGKIKNYFSWLSTIAKYRVTKRIDNIKNKPLVSLDDSKDTFYMEYDDISFSSAYISPLTTCILYNGLLVKNGIKKDYSKEFYSLIEEALKIKNGELSYKVLNHICIAYIKAFNSLNCAFMNPSKESRYIMSSCSSKINYLLNSVVDDAIYSLPEKFKGKKIMIISNHASLIKVQFARLKASKKFKDKFDYSLFAINPDLVIEHDDKSVYFESIDSLRMAVLTFQFDICLIHDDIYALPIIPFVSKLNRKVLVFDDSIYSIFNIVKNCEDISETNSKLLLSLEEYDRENIEASGETKFVNSPDVFK